MPEDDEAEEDEAEEDSVDDEDPPFDADVPVELQAESPAASAKARAAVAAKGTSWRFFMVSPSLSTVKTFNTYYCNYIEYILACQEKGEEIGRDRKDTALVRLRNGHSAVAGNGKKGTMCRRTWRRRVRIEHTQDVLHAPQRL